ncbi:hypothetical protein [Pseudomonas quasicaspiana]|uniref:hypothetical protein n=1 Tax=Pseudomonas quasicaspiana TaxID=2829821 RepID=UPI001E2F8729|nr:MULTISPECIES: hypothetical protein [Pseudomonas]MCD5979101.1 hypothetical protein [Pseudomonas quasicaspiana]
MTQWEPGEFTKKTRNRALLACLIIVSFFVDVSWLGDGSSNRKRVFSAGFVSLCIIVAVLELVILNGIYGQGR